MAAVLMTIYAVFWRCMGLIGQPLAYFNLAIGKIGCGHQQSKGGTGDVAFRIQNYRYVDAHSDYLLHGI